MVRLLVLLIIPATATALEPAEILIVANKDWKESLDVARHYAGKRKVPVANLLELSLPKTEDISRTDYDAKLAGPIREALAKNDKLKVILCVYGVPLRVGPRTLDAVEKARADELKIQLDNARKEHEAAKAKPESPEKIEELRRRVGDVNLAHQRILGQESQAAVDSELMLVLWKPYNLSRWQANPLYWRFPASERDKPGSTLMTCRLDGPTPEIAKRLVDDSIEVEAKGLDGKAYFDARGIGFDPKKPQDATGYGGYDESFREAAALLKAAGLDVTLDNKNELFAPGSCPDAALYAGWYSHANFIDSGKYVKGAVAWHLASSEATTLKRPDSKVWCPNLLKAGVAATLGPVAEPYTIGFPKPAEFFGTLATGKYPLVETYARTVPLASWMTTLIGDPLYNPFAKNPRVKESDLFSSPKMPK
jgi:uncharacterized protein (TIGR03790 family)